jgi:hypothetical protein
VTLILAFFAGLAAAQDELNTLDALAGDGDLGTSMTRASDAVHAAAPSWRYADPRAVLRACAATISTAVGGTSGALLAIFFMQVCRYQPHLLCLNSSHCA